MSSPQGFDPLQQIAREIQSAVEEALPGAEVRVTPAMPGHFEVRVVFEAFRGRSSVEQHQAVYAAIAPLMGGDGAPVHAIDRLETACP